MSRRVFNHLYTLRWDAPDGPHTVTGTSRDIHHHAPRISRLGDDGSVWDIAVHNSHGTDVTGRFFNHLDQQTA